MMIPTIHLNGTSKEELCEQIRNAGSALHDAIEALSKAAPHGRDYYPQGDDAFRKAQEEHNSRLYRLAAVQAELAQIYGEIL